MSDFDVLIIGAGSAGLMCASRLCFYKKKYAKDMRIGVVDSNSKIGRKLAITGNGRCNLTNLELDSSLFASDDLSKVESIISSFNVEDTLDYFSSELGLLTISKNELVYPITNKSSSVIDCFRNYLADNQVDIIFDSKVIGCDYIDDTYLVKTGSATYKTKNLVIATGGASYKMTGSDGSGYKLMNKFVSRDKFSQIKPSLVQLVSNDTDIKVLSGTRINCEVQLFENNDSVAVEQGELLFTDSGVSGICIMQLSRYLNKGRYYVLVDMFPELSTEFLTKYLFDLREMFADRSVSDALSGIILKPITEVILNRLNIKLTDRISALNDSSINRLAGQLKSFRIMIAGTEDLDKAQVTSGGLNLGALSTELEVNGYNGLYACGEILNVDGPCGGYNLQWAWSSADSVARGVINRLYGV